MLYDRTGYYLGDANTVDPLLEGSDIVTAEVLDVLRLLLDLRVLHIHKQYCITQQDTLFTSRVINTTFWN